MARTKRTVAATALRAYTTRNIPVGLVERCRGVAALLGVSLEEAVNLSIAKGVPLMEKIAERRAVAREWPDG